jgi:hypothetical protein
MASCRAGTLLKGVPYCAGVESVTGGVTGGMSVDSGTLLQENKIQTPVIKHKILFILFFHLQSFRSNFPIVI